MVVGPRPSHPNRTYQRWSSGSYSTCWTYSAAATGPSRWRAISSWASSIVTRFSTVGEAAAVAATVGKAAAAALRALHRGAGREVAVQAPQPGCRHAPHVPAPPD